MLHWGFIVAAVEGAAVKELLGLSGRRTKIWLRIAQLSCVQVLPFDTAYTLVI